MVKYCSICGAALREGDFIVAEVLATYHIIPSKIAYSISQPSKCYEIRHKKCWEGPTPHATEIIEPAE